MGAQVSEHFIFFVSCTKSDVRDLKHFMSLDPSRTCTMTINDESWSTPLVLFKWTWEQSWGTFVLPWAFVLLASLPDFLFPRLLSLLLILLSLSGFDNKCQYFPWGEQKMVLGHSLFDLVFRPFKSPCFHFLDFISKESVPSFCPLAINTKAEKAKSVKMAIGIHDFGLWSILCCCWWVKYPIFDSWVFAPKMDLSSNGNLWGFHSWWIYHPNKFQGYSPNNGFHIRWFFELPMDLHPNGFEVTHPWICIQEIWFKGCHPTWISIHLID